MKIHSHRLIGFSILFFSVIILLYFGLSREEIFGFKILAFQGNVEIPDTNCYIKTESRLYKGSLYRETHSNFLIKSPITTFDVIDTGGQFPDVVDKVVVIPKMRCDFNADKTVKSNTVMLTDKTEFKLEILSQDSKKNKVLAYTKLQNINAVRLVDNTEVELTRFEVPITEITKKLDGGSYESYQEMRVSGNIKVYYEKYEQPKYSIYVPDDTIRTFFLVTVRNIVNPPPPPLPNGCGYNYKLVGHQDENGKNYFTCDPVLIDKPIGTVQTTSNEDGQQNPNEPNMLTEFGYCALTGSTNNFSCLNNSTFFPIYIGGFIIFVLAIIAGGIGKKPRTLLTGIETR